jgi:hypothetical protein
MRVPNLARHLARREVRLMDRVAPKGDGNRFVAAVESPIRECTRVQTVAANMKGG